MHHRVILSSTPNFTVLYCLTNRYCATVLLPKSKDFTSPRLFSSASASLLSSQYLGACAY